MRIVLTENQLQTAQNRITAAASRKRPGFRETVFPIRFYGYIVPGGQPDSHKAFLFFARIYLDRPQISADKKIGKDLCRPALSRRVSAAWAAFVARQAE